MSDTQLVTYTLILTALSNGTSKVYAHSGDSAHHANFLDSNERIVGEVTFERTPYQYPISAMQRADGLKALELYRQSLTQISA